MFIYKLHAFLIKSFRALFMIKVHQHALINLVYCYVVTKVFTIQPILFHQYYLSPSLV